jgi:hypothetical protein
VIFVGPLGNLIYIYRTDLYGYNGVASFCWFRNFNGFEAHIDLYCFFVPAAVILGIGILAILFSVGVIFYRHFNGRGVKESLMKASVLTVQAYFIAPAVIPTSIALIYRFGYVTRYKSYETSFREWTACVFRNYDGIDDHSWESVCGHHAKDRLGWTLMTALYFSLGGYAIFVSLIYLVRWQASCFRCLSRMTRRYFRKKSRKKVHAVNADGQIVSPKDKNPPKATQDGKPQDGASKLDDKKNTKGNGSGSQSTPVLQMATIAEGKDDSAKDIRMRPYQNISGVFEVANEEEHEFDDKEGDVVFDQVKEMEIERFANKKNTDFSKIYEEISVASDWVVHSVDYSMSPRMSSLLNKKLVK